ncbi:MAG: sulfatase-like hydrolase/transferase [Bacteroidales bacterium]
MKNSFLPLSLLAGSMTIPVSAGENPNIVYILADDMGYGDVNLNIPGLNAFNNPYIKTPNLAKLAGESIVFTHHYASSPVCSPSRAGLLTGRTPTRCNITLWIGDRVNEDNEKPRQLLMDEEVTIAEICKDAGYQTAIFGKWHLNGADWEKKENWEAEQGSFPNQQGFDYGMVSKENPHLTRHLESNSQKNPGDYFMLDGTPVGTIKGYSSEILTDSALSWLAGKRDASKPFFLYLPYDAVHERIYNPDIFDGMYNTGDPNKDVYYANVTYLDYQIGRFLTALQQMGLSDNTIVFFSSDNGPEVLREYWGCYRSYGTSYPLYGHKRQVYEGGIRVPGMVRWPGKIMPRISGEPNSTMDIFPTLCELLNQDLPPNRKIDGESILYLLLENKPIERKNAMYWQFEFTGNWELHGEGYDRRFHGEDRLAEMKNFNVAIRRGDYVMRGIQKERFLQPAEFVLYDVVNDIEENNELSEKVPEVFENMKKELLQMYLEVNEERIKTAEKVAMMDDRKK